MTWLNVRLKYSDEIDKRKVAADRIEVSEGIVCAYNGTELVGLYDMGAIVWCDLTKSGGSTNENS